MRVIKARPRSVCIAMGVGSVPLTAARASGYVGDRRMTRHGRLYLRDRVPPRSIHFDRGRFGRLFPWLPPFAPDSPSVRERLMELGRPGGLLDARDPPPPASPLTPNPRNRDNPDQTAGVTFLGQFLDHDVTFDPTSSLERQSDPEAIRNFRTPALELDSVYGSGRAASPHLYDQASPARPSCSSTPPRLVTCRATARTPH